MSKVFLVGAGPGDPELLTLKAARVIGMADVILVDDLVSPAVLDHARDCARIVHVGKRGGCKSTPQAFIERLMVAEAQAGRTVVRLKGGDPIIFGRGGEEIATLRRAGVEVEVVNGITSGLAAASAAAVPLTHRAHAQGVVFVTAHAAADNAPDWAGLARSGMTLVIYMGVARAAAVERALLEGGLAAETPALVVQSATLSGERQLVTTLGRLAADVAGHAIASPAVMIIGEVTRSANVKRKEVTEGNLGFPLYRSPAFQP